MGLFSVWFNSSSASVYRSQMSCSHCLNLQGLSQLALGFRNVGCVLIIPFLNLLQGRNNDYSIESGELCKMLASSILFHRHASCSCLHLCAAHLQASMANLYESPCGIIHDSFFHRQPYEQYIGDWRHQKAHIDGGKDPIVNGWLDWTAREGTSKRCWSRFYHCSRESNCIAVCFSIFLRNDQYCIAEELLTRGRNTESLLRIRRAWDSPLVWSHLSLR